VFLSVVVVFCCCRLQFVIIFKFQMCACVLCVCVVCEEETSLKNKNDVNSKKANQKALLLSFFIKKDLSIDSIHSHSIHSFDSFIQHLLDSRWTYYMCCLLHYCIIALCIIIWYCRHALRISKLQY
jgi:hypothetical protein